MDSAIKAVEASLRGLRFELRIFSKEPNQDAKAVNQIKKDITEHEAALKLLKQ